MKYFIFGGSGFVGTHLVSHIKNLDCNAEIYNLDLIENNHGNRSTHIYCDVRKQIEINVPISPEDVIFNLAAIHHTPGHHDDEYFETNILGAENVCAFSKKNDARTIIFTSSIAIYGVAEELKDESTLPTPNIPYGISKLVAEKIHQAWQADDIRRSLLILRPGAAFGKGERGNFTRLYRLINRKGCIYAGRKNAIRACIYVKELVRIMLFWINRKQGGIELYNCAFYPAYTIEQIMETIKKVAGLKRISICINARFLIIAASIIGALGGTRLGIHPARVKKLMASSNISVKKLLATGYHFTYSLEEALADWYRDNDNQCME
jgi:nucleoside-diphosphate-sugar epimerase